MIPIDLPFSIAVGSLKHIVAAVNVHDTIFQMELPSVTTPCYLKQTIFNIITRHIQISNSLKKKCQTYFIILTDNDIVCFKENRRIIFTDIIFRIQGLLILIIVVIIVQFIVVFFIVVVDIIVFVLRLIFIII